MADLFDQFCICIVVQVGGEFIWHDCHLRLHVASDSVALSPPYVPYDPLGRVYTVASQLWIPKVLCTYLVKEQNSTSETAILSIYISCLNDNCLSNITYCKITHIHINPYLETYKSIIKPFNVYMFRFGKV